MSEEQVKYLIERFNSLEKGQSLWWVNDNGPWEKVTYIGNKSDEFLPCAFFIGGRYASLDAALLEDFAIVKFCKEWGTPLINGPVEYTVNRCKSLKNDELYKKSHGSIDGEKTLCGKNILTGWWYITNNMFDGIITCRDCLKEIKVDNDVNS